MIVTKNAMRPASKNEQCFYCDQKIGDSHKNDCVMIKKKATIKMSCTYEIEIPSCWNESDIMNHRIWRGGWCGNNFILELEQIQKLNGCLCHVLNCEVLGLGDEFVLDEDGRGGLPDQEFEDNVKYIWERK